ncbi:MAG: ankyrin repeat domain-containing protein [Treponema sp.]|nr:ankyrin repeat domain-containing protein [Treponema sp.]
MREKKIQKIWQSITDVQKAVLYAYLSFCNDEPAMEDIGTGCDWTEFYKAVERDGYAEHRREVNKILEDVGSTGLIYWPSLESKAKRRLIKSRNKKILSPQVYEFLLFSPALTNSDKNLRDTYFSEWQLVKIAITLDKPCTFVIPMLESGKFSEDVLTKLFQFAVRSSPLGIVQKLVDLGADYKSMDKNNKFPVMNAALRQKDPEVFCYLAEKGCSLTEHDCCGQSILHLAAMNPHSCILERLLSLVPHDYIEEKDLRFGRTPLGMAYWYENKKNMKVLIKAGANKGTAKLKAEGPRYEPDPYEDSDEEIVSLHWMKSHFEWTPENIQKIASKIQAIDRRLNQMYDAVEKAMKFLQSDSIPNNRIKNEFSITASMSYENRKKPLPSADKKMLYRLYSKTKWSIMPSVYASGEGMGSREDQLYHNTNWDIELFDRPEFEHIKIPYYIHVLFVDTYTYTLNDMLYMDPEDFKIELDISFDGEKIL